MEAFYKGAFWLVHRISALGNGNPVLWGVYMVRCALVWKTLEEHQSAAAFEQGSLEKGTAIRETFGALVFKKGGTLYWHGAEVFPVFMEMVFNTTKDGERSFQGKADCLWGICADYSHVRG